MSQDLDINVKEFDGEIEEFRKLSREYFNSNSDYRGFSQLVNLTEGLDLTEYDLYQATLDDMVAGLAAVKLVEDILHYDIFCVDEQFRDVGVGDYLFDDILRNDKYSNAKFYESKALPGDRSTKNFFEQRNGKARLLIITGTIDHA